MKQKTLGGLPIQSWLGREVFFFRGDGKHSIRPRSGRIAALHKRTAEVRVGTSTIVVALENLKPWWARNPDLKAAAAKAGIDTEIVGAPGVSRRPGDADALPFPTADGVSRRGQIAEDEIADGGLFEDSAPRSAPDGSAADLKAPTDGAKDADAMNVNTKNAAPAESKNGAAKMQSRRLSQAEFYSICRHIEAHRADFEKLGVAAAYAALRAALPEIDLSEHSVNSAMLTTGVRKQRRSPRKPGANDSDSSGLAIVARELAAFMEKFGETVPPELREIFNER